jgi:hypothetical protein
LLILICSCTNPRDKRVSSDQSFEYFIEIPKQLDSINAIGFKRKYVQIQTLSELGEKGRVAIIDKYSKKYEEVTFNDLLE